MGRIQITSGTTFGQRELAYSTVIGRHWSCDIIIHHEAMPLRWVELRWLSSGWGWRAMASKGDTIGPAPWMRPGWRRVELGRRGANTIKLRDVVKIELTDADPPQPYALDLQSKRVFVRGSLQELLASVGIQRWQTATGAKLCDGDVLVIEGRPIRLHLPQRALCAEPEVPSLLHADTILKLELESLSGAVEISELRVELTREMVRVLLPYAEVRLDEDHTAWLTRDDAHARWLELGGNPDSPAQRIGWLRGKVRTYLQKNGLADVDSLFESQRVGQWYATRLGLMPEQVVLT